MFVSLAACGLVPRAEPPAATTPRTALDLPQTLAAWRALDHPPARTVDVRREQEGHIDTGPAERRLGIFSLPLIAVALLVARGPTRFQRATVTARGAPERVGDFDADERLYRAWLFDGGVVRVIQRVELPSLHRTYLFEMGHAPRLGDGGMGPVTPTPLLPQGDVAATAARAIDHPEAPARGVAPDPPAWRARVAREAVALLQEESVALVRGWVRERAVSDEGLGALVLAICDHPFNWRGEDLADEARVVRVTRGTLAALGPARARVAAQASGCVYGATHRTGGSPR